MSPIERTGFVLVTSKMDVKIAIRPSFRGIQTRCSFHASCEYLCVNIYSYMLSFGNANVGDLYVNRRVSGKTAFYT